MKILNYAVVAFSMFTIASCSKDKVTTPATTGSVTVKFDNYVGDEPMELNSADYYKNAHGDDFKVSRYKYYVSHVVLKGENGLSFAEPESYHLIDQENAASLSFVVDKVPSGNYTSVEVMIGVDSEKNVSGAQTGALDPANGMFWTWNSGYIMAKFEGTSPQAPGAVLSYHISGFRGLNDVIAVVELPFNNKMSVSSTSTNKVGIKSDLLAWFSAPFLVDFSTLTSISSEGPMSVHISRNYASMFTVTQVQ